MRKQVQARVDPIVKERLDQLAEAEGRTSSDIVKELLEKRFSYSEDLAVEAAESRGGDAAAAATDAVVFERLAQDLVSCHEMLSKLDRILQEANDSGSGVPDSILAVRRGYQRKVDGLGTQLNGLTITRSFDDAQQEERDELNENVTETAVLVSEAPKEAGMPEPETEPEGIGSQLVRMFFGDDAVVGKEESAEAHQGAETRSGYIYP